MSVPFEPYYKDESVTIYNADCREVLPHLPKFDLLLTDPPYGIGERLVCGGKTASFTRMIEGRADKWDIKVDLLLLLQLIDQSDNQIIWGGNFYHLPPCDQPLCWDKIRPNQKNISEWEYGWTSFTGRARLFSYSGNGGFVARESREHPTQKPLALMQWCLSLAPKAKTILDPFAGSGTTGLAATLAGCHATLIEIDESYCEIAANRIRHRIVSAAGGRRNEKRGIKGWGESD